MCDACDLTLDHRCKKVASATYGYFDRNCGFSNWDLFAIIIAIEYMVVTNETSAISPFTIVVAAVVKQTTQHHNFF